MQAMFGRFLKPKRFAPAVPEGIVVYAIGDIHGRADLLRLLLQRIVTESAERGAIAGARPVVIGLGDYIDRGPESREVIDLLVELSAIKAFESHFLLGNHDQTLLEFLNDPQRGPAWSEFGGREALMSYGVRPPAGRADAAGRRPTYRRCGRPHPTARAANPGRVPPAVLPTPARCRRPGP